MYGSDQCTTEQLQADVRETSSYFGTELVPNVGLRKVGKSAVTWC